LSTEWELKRDRNNIKVYLREKNSFAQEYLAETIIESDLKSIYEIIIDYDTSHEWMYKLESSKIIKKETENLLYVYFTVNMNWPLKKRDLVSDVKITQGEDYIIIDLNSVPDYIEKDDNYIRIVDTRSVWNLSKITSDKTKVTLQSYAVIDGLPSFITDLFILESPMYSMTKLREKF
tara:strand:- start:1748 stop:2278 length:531 start_codon:yes stop_codon:yes gene_type:complete